MTDLGLSDTFVDDSDRAARGPELLAQHVGDVLRFQMGEDIADARNWINWLGIRSAKMPRVTVEALGERIRRLLVTIPTFTNVTITVASRTGRTVRYAVAGTYAGRRVDAELLAGLPDYVTPGDDSGAIFYFRARP